jgi:shikimate kinase/3-dehydroquinate synthase
MTWRGRNIYLTGLPGAGKSVIGQALAARLSKSGYGFVDLDYAVEKKIGSRVGEIFSGTDGESQFRDLETTELLEVSKHAYSSKPLVVATGGGTVIRPVNRAIMRGSGVVVWVDVTVKQATKQVLRSILEGRERPLLRASGPEDLALRIRTLLDSRVHFYEQATLHFVTRSPKGDERTPDELAEELFKALEQMSRHVGLRPRFQTFVAKSALGDYPISIGSGIATTEITSAIRDAKAQSVLFLTDKNVSKLHTTKLVGKITTEIKSTAQLHQLAIEPGEASKSKEALFELLDSMRELDISRNAGLIITIGGGVVSDLGGMAASLFKRGIPVIHVPTTLLAQVDASLGGKTGIDHANTKNLLGTFYPPKLVLIDPLFLKTLPKREVHAGLAEIFKYALIGSPTMWQTLSKSVRRLIRGVDPSYEQLIRESVQEKLRYIERDEFEHHNGIRELLNFGHTFAHALESTAGFGVYLHGEAVALGMRTAAWLSQKLGILSEEEWREIEIVLGRIPIVPNPDLSATEIFAAMRRDKKRSRDENRLVLLSSIGQGIVIPSVPDASVRAAIEFMISIA